jgi:hypothetical protein
MFVNVHILLIFNVFNINFQYIKIHHIYATTRQRNVYALTILLVFTTSDVYKVTNLVLCSIDLVPFPDDGPFRI